MYRVCWVWTCRYPRSTQSSWKSPTPVSTCPLLGLSLDTVDRLTRLWISFECFTSGNRTQDKKGALHAPPGGWHELYWGVLAPCPTCRFKDCPMIQMDALGVLCLIRFVHAWTWSLLREISVGDNADLHLMDFHDTATRFNGCTADISQYIGLTSCVW